MLQKADWTRLCFTLSKWRCLCALHLTGVAKVVTIIHQKPTNLNYIGKPADIEDIREFEWTDWQDGRNTWGEMNSVRSSGECEFMAELSLFASKESSEATLYKWAKYLSILNMTLTCQRSTQQQQRMNKNQIQILDNPTARLDVDTP